MPEAHTVPDTAYDSYANMIRTDRSTLLHDEWDESREAGFRFYKITDGVGTHPPLFALSRYTRTINRKRGEMEEEETVLQLGTLEFDLEPFVPTRDYVKNQSMMGESYLPLRTSPNTPSGHYRRIIADEFLEPALDAELEFDGTTPSSFEVELKGDVLTLYFESAQVRAVLANRDGGPEEWDSGEWGAYLSAINEFNDIDGHGTYGFGCRTRISMEQPEEWRLRAVEYQHKGVFKHRPSLAAVKALQESRNGATTQGEIAEILGTAQGNISRQVAELEDWEDRVNWMAENW